MTDTTGWPGAMSAPTENTETPRSGVWRLTADGPIIVDQDGPATMLVPSESVLMLSIDLPLASRARRIDALPFAIEDRIADPIEAVHLALGSEVAPKQYLVGVVRHAIMADWIARIERAGLGHAALIPDALVLPRPNAGEWSVALSGERALVRIADGSGFAVSASLLRAAWESAGRPIVIAYDAPLPADMTQGGGHAAPVIAAEAAAQPALNLRQGAYVARSVGRSPWRRLFWIVAIVIAAQAAIALADVMMLRIIASRRAADTQALVQQFAPGTQIDGDLAEAVSDMLPVPRPADKFLPVLARVSRALVPMAGTLSVESIAFDGRSMVMDIDATDATTADQVRAALSSGGVQATVSRSPSGGVRVTAGA